MKGIIMTQKNKWYHWVMVVGVLCLLGAPSRSYSANDPDFSEFTKNKEIFSLNESQRAKGISPQCDLNGTLCGAQR
jgi:hypothetical protein